MFRYKGVTLSLSSAVFLAVLAAPVSAAVTPLLIGDITFSGDFTPVGGTGLGDATGIDFLGDDFEVDDTTGAFEAEGVKKGDVGVINDFTFTPFSSVTPLWTIGGFSFDLTSLTNDFQSGNFLALSGAGTVSKAGYMSNTGTWTLSANTGGSLFNFSSGTSAVPLPAAAWLFGSVLLGFFGLSRRKQT